MFTGIVEELGEVVAVEPLADAARLTVRGPLVTVRRAHGDSIAVNGVCLTVVDTADGTFTADVMPRRCAAPASARRARRAGQPRARGHAADRGSAATSCRATSTAPARSSAASPASTGRSCASRCRPTSPATSSRRARSPSTASRSPSSRSRRRRAEPWFTVSLIPTTLARTTLGRAQPGDAVNLEVDVVAKYVERQLSGGPVTTGASTTRHPEVRLDPIERADRRHRGRPAGRRRRRRGPRERGRPHLRREQGDARARRLHDPAHLAACICVPMAGRGARPARAAADDARQRGPQGHRLLGHRSTRATASRTGISAADRARTIRVLGDSATEPHELTRPGHVFPLRAVDGRRAAPPRPHRGGGRPRPAGRAARRPACSARSSTTTAR